ncbi:MAG: Crp/Fnr family transcriptional regulator [Lachnospiraceae bacterium]|nr:Crp/Fnr family transcriptional regulator [Lachnospiraceae bacterium]
MDSKQQLLEKIKQSEPARCEYLTALFRYVPDAVVKMMSYKKIQKNQYIIHAGKACDTVYIILSGNIAGLHYQKQGRAYYFMDFNQMYIVGDFEVFGGIPEYYVSICATEECNILTLPSSCYLQWIQHDENALFLRIKNIMATLVFEKKHEREYMFMNCKERLVKYLVKSYENKCQENYGKFKINKTQAELSDRIGFNVRSVQRSIAALENEKLVSIENGKITISPEQFLRLKEYENE